MAADGGIASETEEALVVWVNSFSLKKKVQSFNDLIDGQALWQMLCDIDGNTFSGQLPSDKQSDYSRRHNLKFIQDRVHQHLEGQGKSFNDLSEDELERMAKGDSASYIPKFLKVVLTVMLASPSMTEQVQNIMSLDHATQEVVGSFMQEVADFESDTEDISNDNYTSDQEHSIPFTSPSPDARTDQILQLEQQYAKIMSQLERRNQEYKDLESELEAVSKSLTRSQETSDALNSQITEVEDQLKKARSLNSDREHSSIKDLETQISQQEELIASKESRLGRQQTEIAELQRDRRKLAASSETLGKLQDELDVMRGELEKQTRKANTADKYMQKLQASQGVEKERDSLRQELEDARSQLMTTNKLRQENAALQQSNDESSRILSQIEQEHDELRMTKKQLRVNYDSMARQVDALNERFAQDQETIADLKDRITGTDNNTSKANGDLDGELDETFKHDESTKARISLLERRNKQLESDLQEKDAKINTLQRQLNIAIESSADHIGQAQSLRDEILTLETSLAEVREGHPIEGTETFKRMRQQVKTEEQKRLDAERDLAAARQSVDPTGKDMDRRRSETGTLDLVQLSDMISKASAGQSADDISGAIAKRLDEMFGGRMVNSQERVSEQQKRVEEQDTTIKTLEDRLQKQSAAMDAQKLVPSAAQDRIYIQNLERELKLMSSAYHGLAGRLQMNNVTLQRRAEAPKSWLNRQRRAVEGPTGILR